MSLQGPQHWARLQSNWKLLVTLWSFAVGCTVLGTVEIWQGGELNAWAIIGAGLATTLGVLGVVGYLDLFQAEYFERYQSYRTYLSAQTRKSTDRTRQMFVLNGVPDALAQSLAENQSVGHAVALSDVQRVRVLHGTFGSGKSLAIERTIQAVDSKGKRPRLIPVKFGPGELVGGLSDSIPAAAAQLNRRRSRALLIAIEDLHGYADAAAVAILDGARRLAEAGAFVVITTRHPPRQATEDEKTKVEDLTEEEAKELIGRIQGERPSFHSWHGLSDALRNSLTSPFMAIAFAACTVGHQGEFPQTRAQLTARLLTVLQARVAGQPNADGILSSLRRISVASTDEGGRPVHPPAEVSQASIELANRAGLLTLEGARVNIPLPIVREWLAAEALVRNEFSWAEVVPNLAHAINWRGAVEAAIARGSANQVARILGPLARHWVGIAAEVVHRMTAGWGRIAVTDQPTTAEAAARVLEAMQALADGLGASAELFAPKRNGRLLTLSILANEGSISYRWLTTSNVPWETMSPDTFMIPTQPIWRGRTVHRNLQDSAAWAWVTALDMIEDEMESFLTNRVPMLEGCAPFVAEFTWRNLRAATGEFKRVRWNPIPLDRAQAAIQDLHPGTTYMPPILVTPASLAMMASELRRLADAGVTALEDPHPYPRTERRGPWVWSAYSYDEFVARSESILRAAVQIYQELVARYFPSLRPQLRTSWTLPAFVHVWVMPGSLDGSDTQLWPHAEWVMTRREGPTLFAIERAPNHTRQSWDAVKVAYARHVQIDPVAGDWFGAHSNSSGVDNFLCEMPATTIAMGWLRDDLDKAGFDVSSLLRWRYGGAN